MRKAGIYVITRHFSVMRLFLCEFCASLPGVSVLRLQFIHPKPQEMTRSVGDINAVLFREIGGNGIFTSHQLHARVFRCAVFGWAGCVSDQEWQALIGFACSRNNGLAWTSEIHVFNLDLVFELRVSGQQAFDKNAGWAEERDARVLGICEAVFEQEESIFGHGEAAFVNEEMT